MSAVSSSRIQESIREVSKSMLSDQLSDRELLARYLLDGDEWAFTRIVERHSKMVFGVCSRILNDSHHSADAFQATFLVLFRKVALLKDPDRLRSWLYGVAIRIARKLRKQLARRRTIPIEQDVPDTSSPSFPWIGLLDDAIHQLPIKYREPILLTYLEGLTTAEVAQQLKCPLGTVATRLSRARERIRTRLVKSGFTLSISAFPTLLGEAMGASPISGDLLKQPLSFSTMDLISPLTHILAEGVCRSMFFEKYRYLALSLILMLGFGSGIGLMSSSMKGEEIPVINHISQRPLEVEKEKDHKADGSNHYQTTNFIVEAPTPAIAKVIGEAAERHRKEIAQLWLEKELPKWEPPCPIRVEIDTPKGKGGASTFNFSTKLVTRQMHLSGSLEAILLGCLPHEITHTVMADHFGKPIPRWADEGIALMSEELDEQKRHLQMCREILNAGRGIPLRKLIPALDYPTDFLVLYCEGFSLTKFLVENHKDGKKKLLQFIEMGMKDGWDQAVKEHYGWESVDQMEQEWLKYLWKMGRWASEAKKEDPLGVLHREVQRPLFADASMAEDKIALDIHHSKSMPEIFSRALEKPKGSYTHETVTRLTILPAVHHRVSPLNSIQAYDPSGKSIPRKELEDRLKTKTSVLIWMDGKKIDPLMLQLFKAETIILVLDPPFQIPSSEMLRIWGSPHQSSPPKGDLTIPPRVLEKE